MYYFKLDLSIVFEYLEYLLANYLFLLFNFLVLREQTLEDVNSHRMFI
jgi:hypothetical protein